MKRLLHRAGWLLAAAFSTAAFAAPAGSPDFSYGEGFGHQTVGFNLGGDWMDNAEAMVKGPGGTVYLIGHVHLDNQEWGIGMARLLHDGQKDETFGPSGKKFYKEPSYKQMFVRDAAMQADGKLVVVGHRSESNPFSIQMMACRFESSGHIDASFGDPLTPGCRSVPSPVGLEGYANSVVIQLDGRIVLAGYTLDLGDEIHRAAAVRLRADGTPDPSFGNQGINAPGYRILFPAHVADYTELNDVAQTVSGDLVVTGYIDTSADFHDTDVLVARMKALDGALDDTFDGWGYVFTYFNEGGSLNDRGYSIKPLPDGAVVVAGSAQTADQEFVPIALKLDASGDGFPDFGEDGKVLLNTCSTFPCRMHARDLQIADSGQLLLAGTVEKEDVSDFFVLRLHENGERDSDFGPDGGFDEGVAYVDIAGTVDQSWRVMPQGERVLLAGTTNVGGDSDFAIARLDHGIEETYFVTPDPGEGGSMSPENAQEVNHSDQVEFTVTPEPGFSILAVEGCGVTEFQGMYITAPVTADCVVTAEFTPDLVVNYTAGPNGWIDGLLQQTAVFEGDAKPVEAIGDTGYHFSHWDDGVLDNPRQDTNITQNIDVTALFEANLYEVAPNPGPGGALSPDETQLVPHGGHVQFIVQPDPGFAIGEFSGCGGSLDGNVFTTDSVLEGCKVNVTFVASNQMYSLHYLAGNNGTIDGEVQQSVLTGADGDWVEAVPTPGYQFVTWSDGMTNAQRQDTHVVADIEVTAIFAAEQFFTVSPSVNGDLGGSISPGLQQSAGIGESLVFTLAPDVGFVIQGVDGTCGGSLVGNTFTTDAIVADCSVIANFITDEEAGDAIFSDGFEDQS